MAEQDDDWRSDFVDEDGNYWQEDSTYTLPETMNRGSAPQRLNMAHGFMKHIVSADMLLQGKNTAEAEAEPLTPLSNCRSTISLRGNNTRCRILPTQGSSDT